jgi:hypothetical protein
MVPKLEGKELFWFHNNHNILKGLDFNRNISFNGILELHLH